MIEHLHNKLQRNTEKTTKNTFTLSKRILSQQRLANETIYF